MGTDHRWLCLLFLSSLLFWLARPKKRRMKKRKTKAMTAAVYPRNALSSLSFFTSFLVGKAKEKKNEERHVRSCSADLLFLSSLLFWLARPKKRRMKKDMSGPAALTFSLILQPKDKMKERGFSLPAGVVFSLD